MLGVIVSGMIVTGLAFFIDGFSENYDLEDEANWEENFTFMKDMEYLSKNMTDTLQDENTNWATGGFRIGFGVLRSVLSIPKFIAQLFGGVTERLHLPPWTTSYIILILTVIIIFALASALLRWYL